MEKKKVRQPDLELSVEATSRLADLAARPHHPSAAAANLKRAKEVLRDRRDRQGSVPA
ncbi:MAG TPA: hypothetical protein VF160_13530 [Candidatus Dormibacteraeota bacterium]